MTCTAASGRLASRAFQSLAPCARPHALAVDCCSAKVVEKQANCCTTKLACRADKSAGTVADAKVGCCGSPVKLK